MRSSIQAFAAEPEDPERSLARSNVGQTAISLLNPARRVHPSSANETRAEHAILKSRQALAQLHLSSVKAVSAVSQPEVICEAADPKRLPQSHPKLQSFDLEKKPDLEDRTSPRVVLNDASVLLQTMDEGTFFGQKDLTGPLPTKEATKSSLMSELPSAQVPQLPNLPSMPSILSSHDQMLQGSPDLNITVEVEVHSAHTTNLYDLASKGVDDLAPRAALDPGPTGSDSRKSQIRRGCTEDSRWWYAF